MTGAVEIKLSLAVLTAYARDALFSYLDSYSFSYRAEGPFLSFVLAAQPSPRAADKRLLGAIYNGVVSIRRLDIQVTVKASGASEAAPSDPATGQEKEADAGVTGSGQTELGAPVSAPDGSGARTLLSELVEKFGEDESAAKTELTPQGPIGSLRALSLYFLALSASNFTGYAPHALAVLAEIILGRADGGQSVDDLIRRYSVVKARAVVDLRMIGHPAADLIDSVLSTRDEMLGIEEKLGPSPFEGAISIAKESVGASRDERVVVIQVAKNVTSEQKLMAFLLGYRGRGLYLRPLDDFNRRFREIYQRLPKRGFLEFSLLVAANIDYKTLVECMLEAGALKREIVHAREIGYNDMPPGKGVRISEWLKRGGLYRSVLDSRMERIPTYLCAVDHAY